jgi:hypothetical protein
MPDQEASIERLDLRDERMELIHQKHHRIFAMSGSTALSACRIRSTRSGVLPVWWTPR